MLSGAQRVKHILFILFMGSKNIEFSFFISYLVIYTNYGMSKSSKSVVRLLSDDIFKLSDNKNIIPCTDPLNCCSLLAFVVQDVYVSVFYSYGVGFCRRLIGYRHLHLFFKFSIFKLCELSMNVFGDHI